MSPLRAACSSSSRHHSTCMVAMTAWTHSSATSVTYGVGRGGCKDAPLTRHTLFLKAKMRAAFSVPSPSASILL